MQVLLFCVGCILPTWLPAPTGLHTTLEQTTLTRLGVQQAETWNLNLQQWALYQTQMQGRAGQHYTDLSPVWVLGLTATVDAERARYAQLAAQQEYQRVHAELQFQHAYDRAWQQLWGKRPVINPLRWQQRNTRIFESAVEAGLSDVDASVATENANQAHGRNHYSIQRPWVLWVSVNCAACGSVVTRVAKQFAADKVLTAEDSMLATPGSLSTEPPAGNAGARNRRLDIVVAHAEHDRAIQQWADALSLPLDAVRTGRIRLQHDNGHLTGYQTQADQQLLLLRPHADTYIQVAAL